VDTGLQFLYQAQLDIADVVLISKTDLVMPVLRKKLHEKLKALLTHTPDIISMQHGLVSSDLLFNRGCNSEQRFEIDKVELDEADWSQGFDSIMVKLGQVDSDLLVSRLQMLIHEQSVYRAKGFAQLPNKMMRQVVQGVGSRINRSYDRRWGIDEERSTRLQIIGRDLDAERLMATLRVAEV
jgi:cobalamin biosynthesis protein CobW